MPLPWQLFSGLMINVFAFHSLNCSRNAFRSEGNNHVGGKKLYSSGKYFCIANRFLANKFFLARAYILGKWFVL